MTDHTPSDPPAPRPFTFDRIFSRVDDASRGDHNPQAEGKVHHGDDFEEGRKWGQEEMRASGEARLADVMENLSSQFDRWMTAVSGQMEAHRRQAMLLAYAVAAKLTSALIARHPREEIEALIAECLTHLPSEPRLAVHIAPDMEADVRDKLERLAQAHGVSGNLAVKADAGLSGGAVRIEWESGALESNQQEMHRQIEEMITRHLTENHQVGSSKHNTTSTVGKSDDSSQ